MFRNLVTWSWSVGKIILIGVVVACSVVHGLNLEENLDETSLTAETPCCAKILPKSTDDRFLLIVGTIDGSLKALDVTNGGNELWNLSTDDQPLLSSTFSYVHQNPDGPKLIPSIDGSLYLFFDRTQGESISADRLLKTSIRVGSDIIAGGVHYRTFGVNHETGKVRYVNDISGSKHFETDPDSSTKTFVIKRVSRTIRGIDPVSGTERWNATVGEHELKFWNEADEMPYKTGSCTRCPIPYRSHGETDENLNNDSPYHSDHNEVMFQVSPSQGLVVAFARTYYGVEELWRKKFDCPVVQMWRFEHERLQEESLFSDSKALLPLTGDSILSTDSLLYFGIYQNQHYIIPSQEERFYMMREQISSQPPKDSGKLYLASTDDFETDPVLSGFDECNPKEVTALMLSTQHSHDKGWYLFKHRQTDPTVLLDPNYGRRFVNHSNTKKRIVNFEAISLLNYWFNWQQTVWLLIVSCVTTAIVVRKIMKRRYLQKTAALLRSRSASECKPTASVESQASFTEDSESITPPSTEYTSRFLTDFEPQRCLGKGGFGIVFESRNRVDDVTYAVKRVAVADRPNARIKVMREVKALAKLDHPGIVRYFQSWFESPPAGWQESTDQEVLQQCGFILSQSQTRNNFDGDPETTAADSLLEESADLKLVSLNESVTDLNTSSKNFWNNTAEDSTEDLTESNNNSPVKPGSKVGCSKDDSIVFANSKTGEKTNEQSRPKESPSTTSSASNVSLAQLKLQRRKSFHNATLDKELQTPVTRVFLYIQMQLCRDLTLRHWLESNSARDYMLMLDWFDQIVAAVEYVHNEGMIHRDLKPSNIFFALDGKVKVGDFGLVTDVMHEPVETIQESIGAGGDMKAKRNHTDRVGTFLYMSPEQMKGKPYTHKIDIYSLGLIFFELLVPFSTQMERIKILEKLKIGEFPSHFAQEKPTELNFVNSLIATESEKRPDCKEIRDNSLFAELEPHLDSTVSKRRARTISSRGITSSTSQSSASDHSRTSEVYQTDIKCQA